MGKIGKLITSSKIKLFSIIFSIVTVVCLTTTLLISLNYSPNKEGGNTNLGQTEQYYKELANIDSTYLIYKEYSSSNAPGNSGIAGKWLIGIDINKIDTDNSNNYLDYIKNHPKLDIPSGVVGIDFSMIGYNYNNNINNGDLNGNGAGKWFDAVQYIQTLIIPKSVKYITTASFYQFTMLGYMETPFIGTSRGSSARGLNKTSIEIASSGTTPTSDSFGSMFSLHDSGSTYYSEIHTSINPGTDSWQALSLNGDTKTARWFKWCEVKDSDSQSREFTYYMPNYIEYLNITDETSLGNYALVRSSAKNVVVTSNSTGFVFGKYCFAESGVVATSSTSSDGSTTVTQAEQGLESIKLNISSAYEFRTGTFDKCETLESLIVPYTALLTIPEAFLNQAINLKQVYIPSSVVKIEAGAFKDCEKLERISVYQSKAIESSLTGDFDTDNANGNLVKSSYKFNLPSGLTDIGKDAFANCKQLDTIFVPNNVKRIGYNAFGGCPNVEKVVLPFVGAHAGACDGSCTSESDSASKDFHGLFGWIFGSSSGSDSNFYSATSTYASGKNKSFAIPMKLKEITITNETRLAMGCFNNIATATSISINEGVGSNITTGCFNGCAQLESLSISSMIGGNLGALFAGDDFDGSLTTTGNYKVPGTLTNIKITNMPAVSGGYFHNCTNIKSVEFSDATQYFNSGIFYNNQSLESLILPFIGRHRGYCDNYNWDDYCGWIGWRTAEHRSSLIWLFSSTSHTGTYCIDYYYYKGYIPSTLKSVTITDDTYIQWRGLYAFSSLETVTIDCSPSYIESGFMAGCTNLVSVQVPYIGCNLNSNGASGSSHTFGWIFGSGNWGSACYSANGWSVPETLKNVTIGTSNSELAKSNKIFDNAFNGCESITSIDFKDADITAIGYAAFANCTNLEQIKYPNARYTHVSDYAFYNCKKVRTLKATNSLVGFIPSTVKTIGNYAFAGTSVGYGGHNTNKLDLSSYTSLGDYAFANCLQLDKVVVPENVNIGDGLFSGCTYLETCELPSSNKMVSKYMFKNCVSLGSINLDSVKAIPEGLLYGCSNLTFDSITFNQSITSIGAYAFKGCTGLDKFDFPTVDGTLTIDVGAFQGCTGIPYMTIPAATKVINANGWTGCDDNFFFWVYYPEEDWPSTWVNNWNCYYPVYVIGDLGNDIFTYIYDQTEKAYYITGITKEAYNAGLSGLIRIPSSHNGVKVIGIDENRLSEEDKNDGARSITTQTGITHVILPKGLTKIVKYTNNSSEAHYNKFPFETGKRVDIYTEYTRSEITSIYNSSYSQLLLEYETWCNDHIASESDKANQKRLIFKELKGWKPYTLDSDGYYRPNDDVDEWDARKWVTGGFLYYFDDWQYGSGNTSSASLTPYLKTSSIKFELDETDLQNATYKGEKITVGIVKAILPGEIFENEDVGVTTNLLELEGNELLIFNYVYSNNINVGKAQIKVSVIGDELDRFNAEESYRSIYPLRLAGTSIVEFNILPVELRLIANTESGDYEKEFDNKNWTYSTWLESQIKGIEGFENVKFTGTLATNDKYVGWYFTNDLYWAKSYKITINNIDVTKNFTVFIDFAVEIIPMDVEIVYTTTQYATNGSYNLAPLWDTQDASDGLPIYSYRYIGATITPYAVAKKYGTDEYLDPINLCPVIVEHIGAAGTYPYGTGVYLIKDTYHMYAYLTDNDNFRLCKTDANGEKIEAPEIVISSTLSLVAIKAHYRISKGLITIKINLTGNNAYLIPIDVDLWTKTWGSNEQPGNYIYNYNKDYLTGLGVNSRFIGKLASSSDIESTYTYLTSQGDSFNDFEIKTNEGQKQRLSWQTVSFEESGTYGNGNTYTINFTATANNPYLIYNPTLGIEDESSLYDIVIDASVEIIYETFNPSYFIGLNDSDYETVKDPTYNVTNQFQIVKKPVKNEQDVTVLYREYYYIEYEVDGQEYRFSAEDLDLISKYKSNANLWSILDFNKKYLSGSGTTLSEAEVTFKELGPHVFSVILNARHYHETQYDIWIEAVKSKVRIDSLDKYYDKEPVDLDYIKSKITKIGADQIATIQLTFYDSTGTIELTDPPVDAGKYKVHIEIDAGEFFEPFNDVISFEIYKRVITVDVSDPTSSILFNNQKYSIDLSTKTNLTVTDQGPNGGLLADDEISGMLETNNLKPEIYYTNSLVSGYYFTWKHNWDVTYTVTNASVKDNYNVVLTGTFEIEPLQFIYQVKDNVNGDLYINPSGSNNGNGGGNSSNSGITTTSVTTPSPSSGLIYYEYEMQYDGKFHKPVIEVTYPTSGNYLPAPTGEYELLFSDVPLSQYSSGWTNTLTPYTSPGVYTYYFMIRADYFETVLGQAKLTIKGLELQYDDPAWHDGDGDDNRWTFEYTGLNETYQITVTDPPSSAVVYYDTGSGWTLQEPMFKDIGTYNVKYKIVAPNYETVEHSIVVDIRAPGDPILDEYIEYTFFEGPFDDEYHTVDAKFKDTWVQSKEASDSAFWTKLYYSTDNGTTWDIVPPKYKDIGKYPVQVKFTAKGYADRIISGEIVIKGKTLYLEAYDNSLTFDNKYHNLNLRVTAEGTQLGYSLDYDKDTNVYTLVKKDSSGNTLGSVDLNILYTTSSNDKFNDTNWLNGDGYKNVGLYAIFMKVTADGYESLVVTDSDPRGYCELEIKFLENPDLSAPSPQKFEYRKAQLTVDDIEIETAADGTRVAYWYSATKDSNGNYSIDQPLNRIDPPQELGVYYVIVKISASRNTGSVATTSPQATNSLNNGVALIMVEIVPRELEVIIDSPQYYDGTVKDPNPRVDTTTSDVLKLTYKVQGNKDPIEIGTYTFDVAIATNNPNYVLKSSTFDFEIIKRSVIFQLEEEADVKSDKSVWKYDESSMYDNSSQAFGDDRWIQMGYLGGTYEKYVNGVLEEVTYSGLASNHMILLEFETAYGIRATYVYTTLNSYYYSNKVKITGPTGYPDNKVKARIVEKDADGFIVYDSNGDVVDVTDFYDIDIDISITLKNPEFDLDKLTIKTDYVYDGYAHQIVISTPSEFGNNVIIEYLDDNGRWTSVAPKHTLVGSYEVKFRVTASGYEPTEGTTTLNIKPADLVISIGDMYKVSDVTKALHDKYNAQAHINKYSLSNINPSSDTKATHIRYYDKSQYTKKQIISLYEKYNLQSEFEQDSTYQNGLSDLMDAGEYWCVVFYEDDNLRWNKSYAIEGVELKPRDINIDVTDPNYTNIIITYNGNKVQIYLTYAKIDMKQYGDDGLLSTHLIPTEMDDALTNKEINLLPTYYVQTNSANAGLYNLLTDFEFGQIQIYEKNTYNTNNQTSIKMSNYHPVLNGNFIVEILKKYLEYDEFKLLANKYIKEYDGKVHDPSYFNTDDDTNFVCATDGQIVMQFYDENGVKLTGDQKDVGKYQVYFEVLEGTNYYSSEDSSKQLKADGTPYLCDKQGNAYRFLQYELECTPKEVEIKWDDLILKFNGEYLTPDPYFEDCETDPENKVKVHLKTLFFDSDAIDFVEKEVMNAGSYLVCATFDTSKPSGITYSKNYVLKSLKNTIYPDPDYSKQNYSDATYFVINKLTLYIQLGDGAGLNDISYYSNSAWASEVKTVNTANYPEFISNGKEDAAAFISKMKANVIISTIGYEPSRYQGKDDFNVTGKVYVTKSDVDIDVSDSIDYDIIGSVTIISDQIDYDIIPEITKVYRETKDSSSVVGYTFDDLEILTVKNPKNYQIENYRINGVSSSISQGISQVGDYELTFDIVSKGRNTVSETVIVHITQLDSYIIPGSSLNKNYNAAEVSGNTIMDDPDTQYGFNGNISDLVYSYYKIENGNEVALSRAPYEAGDYIMYIKSKADDDPDVHKNYTRLNYSTKFTISKRSIDLVYELDNEITDDSSLGQAWKIEQTASAGRLNNQLMSNQKLVYKFEIVSLQRGSYYAKKTFAESQNANYQTFTTDNGIEVKFSWIIYQTDSLGNYVTEEVVTGYDGNGDPITSQQNVDLSSNYSINLTFDLNVHYPYLPVELEGKTVDYDKSYHYGTITFSGSDKYNHDATWYQNNTKQYYSTSPIDIKNPVGVSSIDDVSVKYCEPGTYKVYYLVVIDANKTTEKYEECEGFFIIQINKLKIEVSITDPTKDYDGTPAGVVVTGSSTSRYMPDFTITDKSSIVPYSYDKDDIVITYYYGSETIDPTVGCINAGTYQYVIKFPGTDYYEEYMVSRTYFFINRIKLFIANDDSGSDGYADVYDTMVKTFEFTADKINGSQNASQAGCYKLYTISNGVEIPLTYFLIDAMFVTTSAKIGDYKGLDGTLTLFAHEFTVWDVYNGVSNIENVTNNYQLDYSNATISILPAEIVYQPVDLEYEYDTEFHGFAITISNPVKSAVKIEYYDDDLGEWTNVEPKYQNVGHYEVRVRLSATNYQTVDNVILKLDITKAPTRIYYVTALGKTYDGAEVTIPRQIDTNRTEEMTISNYEYKYFKWDETTNGWVADPMYHQYRDSNGDLQSTGNRPINVGKYKVQIKIPASQNYDSAVYEAEFYISKLATSISWGTTNFEYNGQPQKPTAEFVLTEIDKNKNVSIALIITVTPNGSPNDTKYILAGNYEARATIDYANSDAVAANYMIDSAYESIPYTISKRHITISFSKINVYDDPQLNHKFLIKYYGAASPTTDLEFTVSNLVTGDTIKDFLRLEYDGVKEYRNKSDFYWCNYTDYNGDTKLNSYYPRIYNANMDEVQDNYVIDSYNLVLGLASSANLPTYSLQPQTYPYDGQAHSFTFTLDNPNQYLVYYGIGSTNNYILSTNYPSRDNGQPGIPSFTNVGKHQVFIRIADTNGTILKDNIATYVEITKALPDLKPADGFVLGKTYDGKPVDDPEMDYNDKDTAPVALIYKYYKYNDQSGLYDTLVYETGNSNTLTRPTEVGKYKLIVTYPGDATNFATQTYDDNNFIFEIKQRKVTIAIKQQKGTKLYDGIYWSAIMDDTDVEGTGIEGLADGHTIQKIQQTLTLLTPNVGTYYPNSTHRALLSWQPKGQNVNNPLDTNCFIWDASGNQVQDNYVFEYRGEIVISKRTFAYDFNSCIKQDDGLPGYATVNIKGVYEADGSINTSLGIGSNIKIYYYTDVATKKPYLEYAIPVTTVGQPVNIYADIVDTSGNIESIHGIASFVYILNKTNSGDDDLTDGPDDMVNDPTNISLPDTKNKVYDGVLYKDPEYIGPEAGSRTISIVYYELDYYKNCKANGTALDPSNKLSGAPRDAGDYVVILTASATSNLAAQTWEQAFRIKRRPVSVKWENRLVTLPSGKTSLDNPEIATATFIGVFGSTPIKLYVNEAPGYTNVGVWPVTATFYTTNNDPDQTNHSNTVDIYNVEYSRNYILNNPATSFQISEDAGKNPKPDDFTGRVDIKFDGDKVYDTFKYNDPTFTGFEYTLRTPTIIYYTWDYYDNNWPNLDPLQGSTTAPTDVNGYVIEMTIPASPTNPTGYPQEVLYQYFDITPWEVNVKWDSLTFTFDGTEKIPTGEIVDDNDNRLKDINNNELGTSANPTPYPTILVNAVNGQSTGATSVGTYNVVATCSSNNFKIKNPITQMKIVGVEVPEIELVQGQAYTYGDMIILATTDGNYYIYKSDWDADTTHSIVTDTSRVYHDSQSNGLTYDQVFSDLSKVFAVDSTGTIYKIDSSYNLIDDNRQYTMKLDNNKNAKDGYEVTLSLKDKNQTVWKNAQDTTDKMIGTYDIKQMSLPNDDWDVKYDHDETHVFTGTAVEPKVTITLINKHDPNKKIVLVDQRDDTTSDKSNSDYKLEFKYNTDLTSNLGHKGLIYVIGTGNYDFKSDTVNLPLEFEIVDNIVLLELIDNSAARWITAEITDPNTGLASIIGLDADANGNVNIVSHTSPKEANLYLGRIRQEIPLEAILKQFKNYDTKPEMFVVKRPSNDSDASNNNIIIDNDGYVTLDPDVYDFTQEFFGTGYKVCLVKRDSNGQIKDVLDEVTGIVFGDVNSDGYVTGLDESSASVFAENGLDRTTIKDYQYFAGCLNRLNCEGYYNGLTSSIIANYTNDITNISNDFNYFDNDWSQYVQSSS